MTSSARRCGARCSCSQPGEGLPRATFLLDAMLEDGELAWRSLAVALLADELSE
jgi:hypothetical protein